jgi:signal transduction histidine kinase
MTADAQPGHHLPAGVDLDDVLREYMEVTGRLQRTHEALQGEIARLRRELASKDRELELRRRLAALGELAAGVAHEVRNPLGAIQLYSGLLRNQCRQLHLEPALQLLEKIDAGIHAIEGVVQDTLALAPRERQVKPVRLLDVIGKARDAALPVLAGRRIGLQVDVDDPEVHVRVDERGLQRVLVNLVVNAAEAAPPETTIRLDARRDAEANITVAVRDEGPGLPDEVLDRIFDPFFTTKPQGTGLGLTIAHRLIEAYGGELRAGNRPSGGAEFVMVLPVGTPAAPDGKDRTQREFNAA